MRVQANVHTESVSQIVVGWHLVVSWADIPCSAEPIRGVAHYRL